MGRGPDDSWQDRDRSQTEDVGLPEHEWDERRRQTGSIPEEDPADVARLRDPELSETDLLPEHEDDRQQGRDTATEQQNP